MTRLSVQLKFLHGFLTLLRPEALGMKSLSQQFLFLAASTAGSIWYVLQGWLIAVAYIYRTGMNADAPEEGIEAGCNAKPLPNPKKLTCTLLLTMTPERGWL